MGDPFFHCRHGKPAVETEAEAIQMAPGLRVEIEGVQGAVQAGLEAAEHGVHPAERRPAPEGAGRR